MTLVRYKQPQKYLTQDPFFKISLAPKSYSSKTCTVKNNSNVFPLRAFFNHAALVPHCLCQCGGHPHPAANLGPALLRELSGALPGYTGHAEDQGCLTLFKDFYLSIN